MFYGKSMFNYLRNYQTVFLVAVALAFPSALYDNSGCSTSSQAFDVISILKFG